MILELDGKLLAGANISLTAVEARALRGYLDQIVEAEPGRLSTLGYDMNYGR